MKLRALFILALIASSAPAGQAQGHEVAFTSGGLKVGDRGFDLPRPGFIKFDTGFTYQLNYARRFFDARLAALYFEFPFSGTPRTKIETDNVLSPRSYSSLFFTPGIKLKLLPGAKYSPYAMAGVGFAHFRESETRINQQPNADRTTKSETVFDFGFGLDIRLVSIVSLRGEVRDFYSELPPLNVRALRERQHNTLISAGIALRF
jgi:opacity protein-like surface antigen